MTKKAIESSWNEFVEFFNKEIIPIYWNHEKDFDFVGIHGRKHISRSIIIAEVLARFYYLLGEGEIDFEGIRTAVAFHDSGREGNGTDYWENESKENCRAYLLQIGKPKLYADQISQMITNKKEDINDRVSQIVYDADVIEILRLFTDNSGGLHKFRTSELFFLGKNHLHQDLSESVFSLRQRFIKEVWDFINETEINFKMTSKFVLNDFLDILEKDVGKYNLINQFFKFEFNITAKI